MIPRAIYLTDHTDGTIRRVYAAVAPALRDKLGVPGTVYSGDDIRSGKLDASGVEYIFTSWGMPALSKQEIQTRLPALRGVFYGAGTVKAFAQPFLALGITVCSSWAANAVPVAEFTLSQILLANTGYFQSMRTYRDGGNDAARQVFKGFPGNYGCAVGIIGAGMVGRNVIRLLNASCKVRFLVCDPYLSGDAALAMGAEKAALPEIFETCQTISNHLPDIPSTVGMLNRDCFSKMKPNATFINTGRGAQVVHGDLIDALTESPARTALLDVIDEDDPAVEQRLLALPNVLLSPHMAGSNGDALARMGEYAYRECLALEEGRPLQYAVTEEMLKILA